MKGFNELLGFLIVLFVFLLPVVSQFLSARRKRQLKNPLEIENPDEEVIEESKKVHVPPLKPPVYAPQTTTPELRKGVAKSKSKAKKNPIEHITQGRGALTNMVILSEILSPPKGSKGIWE